MKTEQAKRLLSLDVFRGITIAGMILVNSPGNETCYWPLDHAEWNGLTPTDLVFPFFVFIVGISLVFSLSKRLQQGASRSALMAQVFKRSLIIFGLGLLLNGFPHYDLSSIRILGVLQRIALCYFFGAFFFLWTTMVVQIGAIVSILVGYWWVMTHLQVPGFPIGDLTKEGNFAAYIDRALLAGHMYRPVYDPEEILEHATGDCDGPLRKSRWLLVVLVGRAGPQGDGMYTGRNRVPSRRLEMGAIFSHQQSVMDQLLCSRDDRFGARALRSVPWLDRNQRLEKMVQTLSRSSARMPSQRLFPAMSSFSKVLKIGFISRVWMAPPGNLRFYITEHLFSPWLSLQETPRLCMRLCTTCSPLASVFWNLYRRKVFIKI